MVNLDLACGLQFADPCARCCQIGLESATRIEIGFEDGDGVHQANKTVFVVCGVCVCVCVCVYDREIGCRRQFCAERTAYARGKRGREV